VAAAVIPSTVSEYSLVMVKRVLMARSLSSSTRSLRLCKSQAPSIESIDVGGSIMSSFPATVCANTL
jgi:hypothetical protein